MESIERRAEAVLATIPPWLWDGETVPVPIEEIADSHFGLLIRDVEEMTSAPGAPELAPGQSLSGLLLTDRGEIWVNAAEAREWPSRRRFTIGHELGHWLLHRERHHSVFCRAASIDAEPGERAGNGHGRGPDIEEEASVFAAALLMPAWLVRREYVRDRTFERLCERFGASGKAMGRRLHSVVSRSEVS